MASTVGASLTAVTVIVKATLVVSLPPRAVPPLSATVTVAVVEPKAFGFGWKVSVPAGLTAGGDVNSEASAVVVDTVTAWPASSAGPASPASSPAS